MLRSTYAALIPLLLLAACHSGNDAAARGAAADSTAPDQVPVAVNRGSPVTYPQALLSRGIEGQVVLRLYVDSAGNVVNDSTRISESSGYREFDSAAVAAAPQFHYAPGLHHGRPTAMEFLQPVYFRQPDSTVVARPGETETD